MELFHRAQTGPSRLVLTEAAEAAVPDLRAGFERLATAVDRLRASRARRTLTVTVSLAFAEKWLLHRLELFSRDHPDCDLRIDTSKGLVDFAAGQVDVGIRYGAGDWPGLSATYLTWGHLFPGLSPIRRSKARTLSSRHMTCVITSLSMIPRCRLSRSSPHGAIRYERAGLPVAGSERGLHVDDFVAAYRMAMAGQGVALGRTTLVEHDLSERRRPAPSGRCSTVLSPTTWFVDQRTLTIP